MIPVLKDVLACGTQMWRLGALLLAVLVLSGCGGSGGDDDRRTVVAAFYPLAWAAERIAGDEVEVVNLTPPGAEPHDIELTARDVERVEDAELVLYLGRGFMPALEEAVEGHAAAVDLLEGQSLREGSDEHGHGGEAATQQEDEAGEEAEVDPHVWLDPTRLATVARTIATELGEPGAADDVVAELGQLDEEYRAGLANCERREIVTSHAAFGYLADAYGLRQIALTGISPETEPSPRALEELVEEVEETGATTVFFETLVSPRLAETVAREAGAETAALDPLEGLGEEELEAGEDYLSVMRTNLEALGTALGCS
jgi:zinc transport system substrate-binding protein